MVLQSLPTQPQRSLGAPHDAIMRGPVQFIVYPRWPEDGDAWVHPDDVITARRMIPGWRIFCVAGGEGPYRVLRYGKRRLRVRPALWLPVRGDGMQVGDWVAVRSRCGRNWPRIGTIAEMLWNPHDHAVDYLVHRCGLLPRHPYRCEDLQPVTPLRSAGGRLVAERMAT